MKRAWAILLAGTAICLCGAARQGPPAGFRYVHNADDGFAGMVEIERLGALAAAREQHAERWAVTIALLLELSRGAEGGPTRAYGLDAALELLTSAHAWGLIEQLTPQRRALLLASLRRFELDDPAGMRPFVVEIARRRIATIEAGFSRNDEVEDFLDALLAASGWTRGDEQGPRGRQRASDRPEFRAINRHALAALDGMIRRHLLLPPTEASANISLTDLEAKLQRTRNFTQRVEDLWTHLDGPRVHDFILDAGMRDATGIIRLVHADTQLLAQHDRLRRWRLREAMWRLVGGA